MSSSLWRTGPEWLNDLMKWPENPVTRSSPDSAAEAKISQDLLYIAKSTEPMLDNFDEILARNTLRRTLRVFAWINRFIHNCHAKETRSGPLDTTRPVPRYDRATLQGDQCPTGLLVVWLEIARETNHYNQ